VHYKYLQMVIFATWVVCTRTKTVKFSIEVQVLFGERDTIDFY